MHVACIFNRQSQEILENDKLKLKDFGGKALRVHATGNHSALASLSQICMAAFQELMNLISATAHNVQSLQEQKR